MEKARVVIIRSERALAANGLPDPGSMLRMFRKGLEILTGSNQAEEALRQLFQPAENIGIKINTIGRRAISTYPEMAVTLGLWLGKTLGHEDKIIIWDRTNEELKEAGYKLSRSVGSLRIMGTDSSGIGYTSQPVINRSVASLFSRIQAELVDSAISLALLKDHGIAGITGGMKNYFGAIHNPNKYHDSNCDPYLADLFEIDLIRKKHRLTILDALRVQYHRGPSYHPQWNEKTNQLIFGFDPVAVDAVGWKLIENLRAKKGLPTLSEERREPTYLQTAENLGLGLAHFDNIEIIEEEV
ncbi:MAG TPA: DUF362 domain-containing protein [Candidatus Saccharicenans sp.]|nr:DUF362 domain-containing protein [Candidatus Saccharicenans sp.]HOL45362.1 DUF362 domain-containing protein [Candidatus Saccharicenans sp.]